MSRPLELDHVAFSYPKREVFTDLTFSVSEGEFVAVLGPNGAGKTTLAKLASGVVKASKGWVDLSGGRVDDLSARERARRVAVVPQEEHAIFTFGVEELVLMGRTPWLGGFGFEGPKDREIARECLKAVDAEELIGRSSADLSGGERQRVLVARALAQQTPLLVLDEPTSHLDLRHQVGILGLLRELREREGLTVVVISHDVNLAARYAERLVFLGEGRVLADGPPRAVLSPEILRRVYGTRVSVREVKGLTVPVVFPEESGRGEL